MFVLFCLFALTLSQGVECDPNFGKEYKYYLYDFGGSITVYTLNDATSTVKYTPCTSTKVKSENGTTISYHTIDGETTKYATELPAHVAYKKYYNGAECTDAKEIKGKYDIFLTKCTKAAVGGYEMSVVEGGNLTRKFYTDANCTTISTSMDPRTFKCDSCETDPDTQKYICQALVPPSNPGTNPSNPSNPATNTTTGSCDPNFGKDYKYIIEENIDSKPGVLVAHTINANSSEKYTVCNATHYKFERPGQSILYTKIEDKKAYYVKDLPAHISYAASYTTTQCPDNSLIKGDIILIQNGCKTIDSMSFLFTVDGNKLNQAIYGQPNCKGNALTTNPFECGKCAENFFMKPVCHEYGKSNGAVSSFLLMALALILFFF